MNSSCREGGGGGGRRVWHLLLAGLLVLGVTALARGQPPAQPFGTSEGAAVDDWLQGKRPRDLIGRQVVNRSGKPLGKINRIVRQLGGDDLFAVVAVGGVLGIGAKHVAIPLQGMESVEEGKEGALMAPLLSNEDQLKSQQAFVADQYTVLDEQERLGPASPNLAGTPPSGRLTVSEAFRALDRNADGYLQEEEVRLAPSLVERWEQVDRDRNHRIDAAEFSAFEATPPTPQGMLLLRP